RRWPVRRCGESIPRPPGSPRLRGRNPSGLRLDVLNFGRFLAERQLTLVDIVPTDLFDYLDWQSKKRPAGRGNVVRFAERRGPAPATMNRRIAAVRGMFEYAVIAGVRADNPVPAARRSTGLPPQG